MNIYYDRFPTDPDRRREWAVKIKRSDPVTGQLWEPGPYSTICSQHFLPEDFYLQWSRKLLKTTAIPSVFSFAPPAKKRKAPTERLSSEPMNAASSEPMNAASSSSDFTCINDNTVELLLPAHDHSYSVQSPTKLKATNDNLVQTIIDKNNRLRNATRRENTLTANVNDLMQQLKDQKLLTDEGEQLLHTYKNVPSQLFAGKAGGSGGQYSDEQRHFAITMHYYSPAAYEFLRKTIPSMPGPRTIRGWLAQYNGQPGLQQQVFDTIATHAAGPQGWSYKLCSLHMDEMDIKKKLDYDQRTGKIHGFTDIGNGPQDDGDSPQATKVLMVIGVGLNGSWRLPLAYYLTNGANAQLQTSLLKSVISRLWESGSLVTTITFDGLPANLKTMTLLGSNMDPKCSNNSFPHPECADHMIYPVLDACHMMKLARNMLGKYQEIKIPKIGTAQWQHIAQLHATQMEEGLTLANRVTKAHIDYKTQKMRVKLALQVLSSSCATSIKYLREKNHKSFKNSEATELFLRKLDRLFDLLNIRSVFGKHKAIINNSTAEEVIRELREAKTFLLSLENSSGESSLKAEATLLFLDFAFRSTVSSA